MENKEKKKKIRMSKGNAPSLASEPHGTGKITLITPFNIKHREQRITHLFERDNIKVKRLRGNIT